MRKKLERKCKQSVGVTRKAYKGNDTNALSRPWTIVHGGQKIELTQKIHASRG